VQYTDLKKPKHQWAQLYPIDIIRTGPIRINWCMTFEAFNQIIKNIAEGSNYKNVCKRCLETWSLRSARNLVFGRTAAWGDTVPCYVGESTCIHREEVALQPVGVAASAFSLVSPEVCELEVNCISTIRYLGDHFVAGQTWLVHESIDDDSLPPALAKVERLFEVTGGGKFSELAIELSRFTDVSLCPMDGGGMQIPEPDLENSTVDVRVLLVEKQMMTSLRSWVAHGARNFMFER